MGGDNFANNIYFVRHAHSTYTPDELGRPLSTKGLADVERITEILENENIDFIISSPYKRAIQTVEGVAKFLEKEVILEEGFKERTLSVKSVENFKLAITKVGRNQPFLWKEGNPILSPKNGG